MSLENVTKKYTTLFHLISNIVAVSFIGGGNQSTD
jgi:hypothetical protein